jgi:hypothetical protein
MAFGNLFWSSIVLIVGLGAILIRVRMAQSQVDPMVRVDSEHRTVARPKMMGIQPAPAKAKAA